MTSPPHDRLDAAEIAALYQEHAEELNRFLWGVTGDWNQTQDIVQSTFQVLVEQGHLAQVESRKAWLFQVAYRQALGLRRRSGTHRKVLGQLQQSRPEACDAADHPLVRQETTEAVRQAIEELSPDLQQVLRMRIYQNKTFAQIAAELEIPLGTALGRMRNAMAKLRARLARFQGEA